jgi:hypothetical protein
MQTRSPWIAVTFVAMSVCAHAQWVNHPTGGAPRTKDGKANLAAPAPRASNGKPDLSGVWQAEGSPIPELLPLIPGGQNGLGEGVPTKYFLNILADYKAGQEPLQPAAASVSARLSLTAAGHDDTLANCLPLGVPLADTAPSPFKIVQTPGLILMLGELGTTFRQVFVDGRRHPDDPQPSWMGYSVGKWEGSSFVVETIGFNDRGQLDAVGHRHSAALRVTERFHRSNFGHMDMQITLDDPATFTMPVTVRFRARLLPDTDLIEYFCSENEKDLKHLSVR